MSQALFDRAAQERHRALSAGTTPAEHLHPEVVQVMNELGIDVSGRIPTALIRELAEQAHLVITMGCGDECPLVRAKLREDWQIPCPKTMPPEEFREVRDLIERKVKELLARL